MAGRALLLRAEPGFSLPAFERFAPPPPPSLVAARLDAASAPGDVVLGPFGRGGWVAGSAIDHQRKAVTLESTALDRLLAEVVLRPPDLRHLDAAIQALAASARRETSLKTSITDRYASRCATCDRPVVLDELTWSSEPVADDGYPAGPRPVRKHYRCPVCRDQLGGGEARHAPVDATDLRRALDPAGSEVRAVLRDRFPFLEGGESLPDELLDLHTPRQLDALAAILERVEGELRAAPIEAALRLALLPAIAPASRLTGAAGRVAPLRIAAGPGQGPGGGPGRGGAPPGASRRCGSRPGTSRSRAASSGGSATRGPRSRTASASSEGSSSAWKAGRGGRCPPVWATTSGAWPRVRRRQS